MTASRLLLIKHDSPLRTIGEEEMLSVFSDADMRTPRSEFHIDTRHLAEDVEGGHWTSSDIAMRGIAAALADRVATDPSEVHYFGIPEVPHVLALGAYVGDEVLIHAHDYNRTTGSWAWPSSERTIELSALGIPRETITHSGDVTLIVEISYAIDQRDVDAVVGDESLASIRISVVGDPAPGIVRSSTDVMAVRQAVREALSAIGQHRPAATRVHLFVAAPVSVCLSIGQELRLRNTVDVQTYRFRARDAERHKPAILLTARALGDRGRILTDDDRVLAAELRTVFQEAHSDVKAHAHRIATDEKWYMPLEPSSELRSIRPFGSLIPLSHVIDDDDAFSLVGRDVDYAFPKERPRKWEMSDILVLNFYDGAGRDRKRMRELSRMFFYHEYLHDWQTLTKYTAEDVGSFANCLETIDYMADAYALLHQLDFAVATGLVTATKDQQQYLAQQIKLMIGSFWAFEPSPPHYEWQERRLRRYLNWYWRLVQMREAADLTIALRTLATRPSVEIVGFKYRTGRGRLFVMLDQPRPGDIQEVGVVLEDGRFLRRGTTTDLAIEEVMLAFGEQDREAIDRFFNSLFDHAKQSGAVFAAAN